LSPFASDDKDSAPDGHEGPFHIARTVV
jgi:hypothetical protein